MVKESQVQTSLPAVRTLSRFGPTTETSRRPVFAMTTKEVAAGKFVQMVVMMDSNRVQTRSSFFRRCVKLAVKAHVAVAEPHVELAVKRHVEPHVELAVKRHVKSAAARHVERHVKSAAQPHVELAVKRHVKSAAEPRVKSAAARHVKLA